MSINHDLDICPEKITKLHKELWEIIDSGDAKNYVIEDIIPIAMQIVGRMAHIVDVISPNWQKYIYPDNKNVDGYWLFNDLFGMRTQKVMKELTKNYPTPEMLAKLMDCAALYVFEILGGACNKSYKKSIIRKNKAEYLYKTNHVSAMDMHWAGILLLIISNWEYIRRICNKNLDMYSYTRSVFWLNNMLSEAWNHKRGYETAKRFANIKEWVLNQYHEISVKNKTLTKRQIAYKIYRDKYKPEEWPNQLKKDSEFNTIYRWILADKMSK